MMIESVGDYILKAIRKLQKENIRSMVVKPERVKDFLNYCDEYFKGTVYAEECRSWFVPLQSPLSSLMKLLNIVQVQKRRQGSIGQYSHRPMARQHPPLHRSSTLAALGGLRLRIPPRDERRGRESNGVVGQRMGRKATRGQAGSGRSEFLRDQDVSGERYWGARASATGGKSPVYYTSLVVLGRCTLFIIPDAYSHVGGQRAFNQPTKLLRFFSCTAGPKCMST